MANPQRENGHIDIANELWEQIWVKGVFTKYQGQIVACILNESWRWVDKRRYKQEGSKYKVTRKPLTNQFISNQTGIPKSKINDVINELYKMGAINCHFGYYAFQKDYESYRKGNFSYQIGNGRKKLPKRELLVTEKVTSTPKKPRQAKPSQTLKEKKERSDDEAVKISSYLKGKLKGKGIYMARDWHLKSCAVARAILKSGVPQNELMECIDWALADAYWGKRVDSMMTIEKVLPRFQAKRKASGLIDARELFGDEPT